MIKLICIEWKKVLPYTTFWVFCGLYIFLVVLAVYWVGTIEFMHTQDGVSSVERLSNYPIYEFPDIWQNVSYIASLFSVVLGLLIIVLSSNEYEYRTLKQNCIDGLNRNDLLFSKVLLVFLLAGGSTVFIFILCSLIGVIVTTSSIQIGMFSNGFFILIHFTQLIIYLLFALLISLFFKRSGLSILLFLTYSFIVFPFLYHNVPESLVRWVPMGAMVDLIQFPFLKYFGESLPSGNLFANTVTAVSFGALCLIGSLLHLRYSKL